jgi:hypothetical protein
MLMKWARRPSLYLRKISQTLKKRKKKPTKQEADLSYLDDMEENMEG